MAKSSLWEGIVRLFTGQCSDGATDSKAYNEVKSGNSPVGDTASTSSMSSTGATQPATSAVSTAAGVTTMSNARATSCTGATLPSTSATADTDDVYFIVEISVTNATATDSDADNLPSTTSAIAKQTASAGYTASALLAASAESGGLAESTIGNTLDNSRGVGCRHRRTKEHWKGHEERREKWRRHLLGKRGQRASSSETRAARRYWDRERQYIWVGHLVAVRGWNPEGTVDGNGLGAVRSMAAVGLAALVSDVVDHTSGGPTMESNYWKDCRGL